MRDYGTGLPRLPKPAWDREAYARSAGWGSWLERQDAIAENKARYARGAYGSPPPKVKGFARVDDAAALGVTARELTPEEIRHARAAMGIAPGRKPYYDDAAADEKLRQRMEKDGFV